MKEDRFKDALDFVAFAKEHDITANGRLSATIIEEQVSYCKRQFDRIFKAYSKFTPLEFAERIRLLKCVESIRNGNTLIETAFHFDFTPQGLSNAIRTKLNLNVITIKKEGFEMAKHLKISTSMVQLDQYQYQLKKDLFFEYIEALDEEKILTKITGQSPNIDIEKGIELHFDYKKAATIISKYDGCKIDRKTYENLDLLESVIMHIICKKEYDAGNEQFEMRTSEVTSLIFIIAFFFSIETINLKNDNYHLMIKNGLRIILESLKEIEEVPNESFEIILQSTLKGDVVITEFNSMFKEMMMITEQASD